MWKYIKKQWRGNLLAVILLCAYISCSFLETFLLMGILDDIADVSNRNSLEKEIGVFLLVLVIGVIAYYAGSVSRARVHAAMRDDIRCTLSNQIGTYTYQEFRKKNVADYIAWYSTNIEQISMLGFSSFYSICTTMFQTIIAVISLGIIYWKMSIYSLFFIVILYLLSVCTQSYIIRKSKEKVASNEVFLQKINDILQGFSVLYCYKKMNMYHEKMEEASRIYEMKNIDNTVAQVRVNVLLLSVNIVFQSSFLIVAIWAIYHGLIRASAIIGIYSFLPKVFDGITDTIQLKNAMLSTRPYFDLIKDSRENRSMHTLDEDIQSIELKNVSYAYGHKQVISNIDYKFERGKKYALIGKSGCGKSTLLKIIAGLLSDYQGEIEINGKKLNPKESVLSQIAYIDQQPILFEGTISENICLWNVPDKKRMISVLRESGLTDYQNVFANGLDTLIIEGGKNLSGGQKQRIAIARALYARKQLLFIDEGTSALDESTRKIIEDGLIKRDDLTIIMISHHLTQEEQQHMDGILCL